MMKKCNKNERVTIVTAANDAYALPLTVMLRSLEASIPDGSLVDVQILTLGLSSVTRNRIEQSLTGGKILLREIRVDASILDGVKVNGHVTLETYFRLLAPAYLDDVEKAIYLDADLVIRHSILDLWAEPLHGAHLLAVPHISRQSAYFSGERGVPSYAMLGIPGDTRTFNAGVMVLNLEAWRRSNTTALVLQYLRKYHSLVLWWDQDGLNAMLHANWHPLAAKWNVMTSHFIAFSGWQDSLLDEAVFDSVCRDPGIIHFSSVPKPWESGYSTPFGRHWMQWFELLKTIFHGDKLAKCLCQHSQTSQ